MIDRLKLFLDFVGGGAWPFLVGGVICLVNSVNERDLSLLNSYVNLLPVNGRMSLFRSRGECDRPGSLRRSRLYFLEGLIAVYRLEV